MKTFGYAVAVLLSSSPLFAAGNPFASKDDDVSYQLFHTFFIEDRDIVIHILMNISMIPLPLRYNASHNSARSKTWKDHSSWSIISSVARIWSTDLEIRRQPSPSSSLLMMEKE